MLACLTHIESGGDGITIKARGKAISTAVDVAQILTKRMATDIKIVNVSLNNEQVKSSISGETSSVSSIEIRLERQPPGGVQQVPPQTEGEVNAVVTN